MTAIAPRVIKAHVQDDYDAAAPAWEPYMGPYFRFPAERLVADLAPRPGHRCLDLACGSGLIARAFAARVGTGLVAACDLSPEQVDRARAVLADAGLDAVDVRVMDAERLSYPPGSFDRVGCGFGINHFPRPTAAIRGVLRVLAPGGRAGFTVWGGVPYRIRRRFDERLMELVPGMREAFDSPVEAALGRIVERNSRPERLMALMERAGFEAVERRGHRFVADYVDADWFVDAMLARAERDLRAAGVDASGRAALREELVTDLATLPRSEFVVRREYHVLLGRRPRA
jgi:ubiquinone/menaquinone biosynthesis C-methylase UbiE